MKFSIKDFFSKSDQICRKLRIWSHLLKKSFMENFVFCAVCGVQKLMSHWNCPFLARTGISFQNSLHIFKLLIMFDVQYWKCNNICSAWKVKEKLKISWFFILWLHNFLFFSKNLWHPPPWKKIDPLQNQNFLTPSRVFSKSFNVPLKSHFRGVCACHAVALLFAVLILLSYKWISWQKWFYFWRKKILQDIRKGRSWRRNSHINQFRNVTLSSWRISRPMKR